jgi:hypothetical protein
LKPLQCIQKDSKIKFYHKFFQTICQLVQANCKLNHQVFPVISSISQAK